MRTMINYTIASANQYGIKSKSKSKTLDIDFGVDYLNGHLDNDNILSKAYKELQKENKIGEHIYNVSSIVREDCQTLIFYIQTRGKEQGKIKEKNTMKTDKINTRIGQKSIQEFLEKNPGNYEIVKGAIY